MKEDLSQLTLWNTPFWDAESLSVSVIADLEEVSTLTVVAAPDGIDRYPKYLLAFRAAAFKSEDESVAPTKEFSTLRREPRQSCTYYWLNSPWLREYEETKSLVDMYYGGRLKHFVVLGGDTIVEILAVEDPEIKEVTSARVVAVCEI